MWCLSSYRVWSVWLGYSDAAIAEPGANPDREMTARAAARRREPARRRPIRSATLPTATSWNPIDLVRDFSAIESRAPPVDRAARYFMLRGGLNPFLGVATFVACGVWHKLQL